MKKATARVQKAAMNAVEHIMVDVVQVGQFMERKN